MGGRGGCVHAVHAINHRLERCQSPIYTVNRYNFIFFRSIGKSLRLFSMIIGNMFAICRVHISPILNLILWLRCVCFVSTLSRSTLLLLLLLLLVIPVVPGAVCLLWTSLVFFLLLTDTIANRIECFHRFLRLTKCSIEVLLLQFCWCCCLYPVSFTIV